MEENVKKTPLRKTQGWQLKKEFIDVNGDVYNKGKFSGQKVEQTEDDLKWLEDNQEKEIVEETTQEEPVDKKEVSTDREKKLEEQVNQLQALMNKMLAEKQPQEGVIVNATEEEKFGTLNTKNIPAEDYDSEETTFIHRGRGTIVSFRTEEGQHIYAPYNMPIVFTYHHTEEHRSGQMTSHNYYATFKTRSKAEKEFLRLHEKYNITIFEQVDKAVKFDMETSVKMGNLSTWVNSLKPDQVYGEAARRNIPLTGKSMEELKMAIMFARFDELSREQNSKTEQRVANMNELFKK